VSRFRLKCLGDTRTITCSGLCGQREMAHELLQFNEERLGLMMRIINKTEKNRTFSGMLVAATFILLVFHCARAMAGSQEQSARSTFSNTCATCHGQNGIPTAVGKSLNAPDLGSADVQNHTNAQLQQIISDGKGNMPSFKGNLSEAQINSLVTYIRAFSKQHKQANH
jgi:cytochrome c553